MTDQQPHTPTTDEIRRIYALKVPHDQRYRRNQEFWRWLTERDARIEAAAEQRGAVKALRDAATAIEKNDIVFDGDHYQPCNSCMSIHMNWLDYRADQMEGDDEA